MLISLMAIKFLGKKYVSQWVQIQHPRWQTATSTSMSLIFNKKCLVNFSVAKAISHTFRYIDDITPLNDKCLFESYRYQIYPEELELNREYLGFNLASVLEMQVDIIEGKFRVNVYDKRDHFNFKVFRFPSINYNIPDKTLYNVFIDSLLYLQSL